VRQEVEQVREIVSNQLHNGAYLVVTGPNGVGKSCMLSTALHRRWGVVTISVRDTLFLYTYMVKASPVHRLNLEKIRTL
jgi:ABC-type Mn2+/Zn2+ transport system ATPase subunit